MWHEQRLEKHLWVFPPFCPMPWPLEERDREHSQVITVVPRPGIANQPPGIWVIPAHISRAVQVTCSWPQSHGQTVRSSWTQITWTPQTDELIQCLLIYATVVLRVCLRITVMASAICCRDLPHKTPCAPSLGRNMGQGWHPPFYSTL